MGRKVVSNFEHGCSKMSWGASSLLNVIVRQSQLKAPGSIERLAGISSNCWLTLSDATYLLSQALLPDLNNMIPIGMAWQKAQQLIKSINLTQRHVQF